MPFKKNIINYGLIISHFNGLSYNKTYWYQIG